MASPNDNSFLTCSDTLTVFLFTFHLHIFSQKAPLHYAAESGKLDVVTLLLQQGAQVDGRMNGMWSGFFTTKMVIMLTKVYSTERDMV